MKRIRENNSFLLLLLVSIILFFTKPAFATELRFSETQMPLGTVDSYVPLDGSEYNSFNIAVTGAYRYWDDRDPFSDGAENYNGTDPYGISLDFDYDLAKVDFLNPVSNLEFDWWTIDGTVMEVEVFDTSGAFAQFSDLNDHGTISFFSFSNIDYITFGGSSEGSSGYVLISNLRFDIAEVPEPAIPEPATMLLLGSGLMGLVGFRRFRKR